MNNKLLEEMNDQINKEIFSGYLYLSMAAHFAAANLNGFSKWMEIQAEEELEHGLKFFEFLNDVGEKVVLKAIEQPKTNFGSPVEVFEEVFAHEKFVTGRIHMLYEMASKENDYATQMFLHWFINEQVEEEKNATEILEKLKIAGDSGNAILMLDRIMGERKED